MFKKSIIAALSLVMAFQSVYAATVSEQELQEIRAQVDELVNGATPLEQRDLSECAPILTQAYDAEVLDFLTFLETHFSNKSSNTSLTNVAIVRYTQFKKNIESAFARISANGTSADNVKVVGLEFEAYQKCSLITDLYLEVGKDIMMRHIKSSAAAKKTTVMLEKYQAINEKLNDLNFEISTMYAHFLTFKNKLPGFLTQCLTN